MYSYDFNSLLKHILTDCVDVADARQTFTTSGQEYTFQQMLTVRTRSFAK
jgi:hypothetical protein